MEQVTKAYADQGIEVNKEEKPLFQMIGAKDGVIFYIDSSPVKIYEYESIKDLDTKKKDFSLIEKMHQNKQFVLESKNEKAIEIFNKIK